LTDLAAADFSQVTAFSFVVGMNGVVYENDPGSPMNITVTSVFVPEPSTLAFLVAGSTVVLARQRRRPASNLLRRT